MLYGREGRSSCGCDGMVVGFITTYVISAYHHLRCEFESRSWRGMLNAQHYVIKFVSNFRYVGGFHPPIKLTATI